MESLVEDALFIYAPSTQLDEGKAIGSARARDLKLAHDLTYRRDYHTSLYAKRRKIGHTVASKKLIEIQTRTERQLLSHLSGFRRGKIDEDQFRSRAVATMREAWKDSFIAGIRASGFKGQSAGKGKITMKLMERDHRWLKGAAKHEMRFLNRFIRDVVGGEGKLSYPVRAKMYVESLRAFFESARVLAMPNRMVIHWIKVPDHRVCEGCAYLARMSPFTKHTLPCTPRAGLCSCISRCRCRLLIRRATETEVRLVESKQLTRRQHLRNLRRIKQRKRHHVTV
jgi:hypothetical protein